MRVVLATDKFKGSLTAAEVAEALGRGLRRVVPDIEVVRVPVADGGDGTLDAFVSAGYERHPVTVSGPCGEPVRTAYARREDVAVVELADASGLSRLGAGLAPLDASTRGTGDAVRAAVDAGCREVVVGLGGSASTDGGAGMVTALGARILDAQGRPVRSGGIGLLGAASLDLEALHHLMDDAVVTLASDVDNPLLGPGGAAAVYGPQKGATAHDVALLEKAPTHWADLVAETTGRDQRAEPGAGAAGGTGFGAIALLGAKVRSGAATVLDLVGFADVLAGADLVVTGEGSFDQQSLRGKAPFGVLAGAWAAGLPTVVVCGRCTLAPHDLAAARVARLWSLTDREPDQARSMSRAAALLDEVGVEIAGWLLAAR